MAYLRLGRLIGAMSDVHVFACDDSYYGTGVTCRDCALESEAKSGRDHFLASGTQEMIDHLDAHRLSGHRVPFVEDVVAELWRDDAENFPPR